MGQKLYLILSGAIFFLVSLFHFARLAHQWPIVVGPHTIPIALSYVGGPASLAYCAWAGWLLWAARRRRGFAV